MLLLQFGGIIKILINIIETMNIIEIFKNMKELFCPDGYGWDISEGFLGLESTFGGDTNNDIPISDLDRNTQIATATVAGAALLALGASEAVRTCQARRRIRNTRVLPYAVPHPREIEEAVRQPQGRWVSEEVQRRSDPHRDSHVTISTQ